MQEDSFELPSIQQEVQFCYFGNFVVCCSSVPVVVLCELFFSEIFLDKLRLYYVSECGSSIVSLESVIF